MDLKDPVFWTIILPIGLILWCAALWGAVLTFAAIRDGLKSAQLKQKEEALWQRMR